MWLTVQEMEPYHNSSILLLTLFWLLLWTPRVATLLISNILDLVWHILEFM